MSMFCSHHWQKRGQHIILGNRGYWSWQCSEFICSKIQKCLESTKLPISLPWSSQLYLKSLSWSFQTSRISTLTAALESKNFKVCFKCASHASTLKTPSASTITQRSHFPHSETRTGMDSPITQTKTAEWSILRLKVKTILRQKKRSESCKRNSRGLSWHNQTRWILTLTKGTGSALKRLKIQLRNFRSRKIFRISRKSPATQFVLRLGGLSI